MVDKCTTASIEHAEWSTVGHLLGGSHVSVVMFACNDGSRIQACLESVKWAGEIVVLDMYSDDDTVRICREYTDRIYEHERLPQPDPARNYLISLATKPWVLMLDPDERVPEELTLALLETSHRTDIEVVWIRRVNVVFGKPLMASGAESDWLPRFFRRGFLQWTSAIHSCPQWEPSGHLKIDSHLALIHESWTSMDRFIEMMVRYTSAQANEDAGRVTRISAGHVVLDPLSEFWRRFVVCDGYRDGMTGLIVSLAWAIYYFVLRMRQWELLSYSDAADGQVLVLGRFLKRLQRVADALCVGRIIRALRSIMRMSRNA